MGFWDHEQGYEQSSSSSRVWATYFKLWDINKNLSLFTKKRGHSFEVCSDRCNELISTWGISSTPSNENSYISFWDSINFAYTAKLAVLGCEWILYITWISNTIINYVNNTKSAHKPFVVWLLFFRKQRLFNSRKPIFLLKFIWSVIIKSVTCYQINQKSLNLKETTAVFPT